MKNSTLKFLLVISLVLNLSFLGAAGYRYFLQAGYWTSPFGTKLKKGHFLFEKLSLPPEQLRAMREESTRFRAEIDRRRGEIAGGRKALLDLLRQEQPDQRQIEHAVHEISARQEAMQQMIALHMLKVKSSLDREQQKKFMSLIESAMAEGGQIGCPPAAAGE